MDVKFLTFIGKKGEKIRRFQYTAIDDATRVRALKVYEKHTQANAIDFTNHIIEKFPFHIREIRTDTAMSSKPNSIGTSRTSVSATPTSSAARLSSMGKSNDHTDQTVRNSTNFSAIKVMSISKKNWENGSAFTTSIGHMALTTEKRLTKHSEKSYNQ